MTKIWSKENNELILLLIISFISVYYLPKELNGIIFIAILILVYNSRRDYFWLSYFFILNDAPGRLFSATSGNESMRIPIYTISSNSSISFNELFLILYIIKTIIRKTKISFMFNNEFKLFFIYAMVVIIYTFLINFSINTIILAIRDLIPWLWILIVPLYLNSEEKFKSVNKLIFPMVALSFISFIFTYFSGTYLDSYLRGAAPILNIVDQERGTAIRSYSSNYLSLYCLIQTLFYLLYKNSTFNKIYLNLIVTLACLNLILPAMRGYIIALIFLLIVFFILLGNKQFKYVLASILFIIATVWTLFTIEPVVKEQMTNSLERFLTLNYLVEGDLSAGGTLQRLDVRGPHLWKKFEKSPIVGWGFSDDFYAVSDGHVGHHNILLNVGIIGYVILSGILISILFKIYKLSGQRFIRIKYKNAPFIYLASLLAIYIIHSSSTQFWGFSMYFDTWKKILVFAFLFSAINVLYNQNKTDKNRFIISTK